MTKTITLHTCCYPVRIDIEPSSVPVNYESQAENLFRIIEGVLPAKTAMILYKKMRDVYEVDVGWWVRPLDGRGIGDG